ncbi:MAG: peptide chain release factor N(5)-glutamine methyltransferase [Crocinitomicaceae bacterium]
MFVQVNTIQACVDYFNASLTSIYSKDEVKQFVFLTFSALFGYSKADLMLKKEDGLSESELLQVRSVVKRLLKHEPIQYILSETHFCELKFKTDSRALIPRPETEELVRFVVDDIKNKIASPRILDLCTGSGCIALALKSELSNAQVIGMDAFQDAIDLANENKESLQLDVNFELFDVFSTEFESFLNQSEKFDYFVSNPPYIPWSEQKQMDKNVVEFEPFSALFVENESPFIFYERIGVLAKNYLKISGKLIVEIHEDFAKEIESIFLLQGFAQVKIIQDLNEKNRFVYGENC